VRIIIAVRHGESASNHAFQTARQQGRPVRMPGRDADVPLSDLGVEQAADLGRWWAELPEEQRPTIALCSPYLRARETLRIATERAGVELPVIVDDRLCDRLKGDFELWNDIAVAQSHPHEAARRKQDGVFHYVPPGGESLWNVGNRVRDLLTELAPRLDGQRVIIVAHDAVVLMLCQVLEDLDHEQMLVINDGGLVPNASLSTWRRTAGRWTRDGYGVAP
jgi:2,3-bisphosphoglycerate-dependent phosphoglycerate mutase